MFHKDLQIDHQHSREWFRLDSVMIWKTHVCYVDCPFPAFSGTLKVSVIVHIQ